MKWVTETIKEVLHELDANPTQGLTPDEVKTRQNQYGLNEFEEETKETFLRKVLHHLAEIPTGAVVVIE